MTIQIVVDARDCLRAIGRVMVTFYTGTVRLPENLGDRAALWKAPRRPLAISGRVFSVFGFLEIWSTSTDQELVSIHAGFGFRVLEDEWQELEETPVRIIRRVEVVKELGP